MHLTYWAALLAAPLAYGSPFLSEQEAKATLTTHSRQRRCVSVGPAEILGMAVSVPVNAVKNKVRQIGRSRFFRVSNAEKECVETLFDGDTSCSLEEYLESAENTLIIGKEIRTNNRDMDDLNGAWDLAWHGCREELYSELDAFDVDKKTNDVQKKVAAARTCLPVIGSVIEDRGFAFSNRYFAWAEKTGNWRPQPRTVDTFGRPQVPIAGNVADQPSFHVGVTLWQTRNFEGNGTEFYVDQYEPFDMKVSMRFPENAMSSLKLNPGFWVQLHQSYNRGPSVRLENHYTNPLEIASIADAGFPENKLGSLTVGRLSDDNDTE